jgi:hypothetical protein
VERFGVGEHTWVAPDYRGKGFGSSIVKVTEAVMRQNRAGAMIGEFNDPMLMTPEERELDRLAGVTPEGRLLFWARQGYTQLDAPYVQPPLEGQTVPVEHLMFGYKPFGAGFARDGMSAGQYVRVLEAYFGSFVTHLEDNVHWLRLRESLEGRAFLRAIALSEQRTFYQGRTDLNGSPNGVH